MNSDGKKHTHEHTLTGELICHLPYAIFSVAFSLGVLSFMSVGQAGPQQMRATANLLFHSFHFMHIVFAATGTLITFLRFSRNIFMALLVGIFSPAIFCMLSDAILPYLGGRILGVPMSFHLCFVSELPNVLPFLFVGILNGFVMSRHYENRQGLYSLFSHTVHILVSSLASLFYLVSHGFVNWYASIGMVFLFLIGAVVIPCTLSDVVIPMMVAKVDKKK